MDLISLIVLAICSVLLAQWLVRLYNFYKYVRCVDKIPGPANFPALLFTYNLMKQTPEERTQTVLEHNKLYKAGIWKVWIGKSALVRFRKPELLEKLLPSTEHIDKSFIYSYLEMWLGKGLLTSTGDKWARDRKMLTPAFHFNILEQFAIVMHEKVEILIEKLQNRSEKYPNQPLDIFPYLLTWALDIICETAMGINIHAQDEESNEYVKATHLFSREFVDRIMLPHGGVDFIYFLTTRGRRLKNAVQLMHAFTDDVIRKRKLARQKKAANEDSTKDDSDDNRYFKRQRKAFLDLLLDANEQSDNPLSDQEIREQVDTFLFAGHDTTAAAMGWCLYALACHPEIQERVHEELDDVFGDSVERPTMAQLSELKYLDRVMKESLRLYPSAPEISRCLKTDLTVGGYFIPKGTHAAIAPLLTHRDEEIWPDPLKFDPDRFLPENAKNRHSYAYIPFSAGPRNCIGQKFAQLEEKIGVSAVLRRFRIKLSGKPEDTEMFSGMILRPSNGIFVNLTPKKSATSLI